MNDETQWSEYVLCILFFPAMYFLLQRIRIVNYWLSWWKWGYCLNTTHKSVGSHRSRFMLSRCQRFCNWVYPNWYSSLFSLHFCFKWIHIIRRNTLLITTGVKIFKNPETSLSFFEAATYVCCKLSMLILDVFICKQLFLLSYQCFYSFQQGNCY